MFWSLEGLAEPEGILTSPDLLNMALAGLALPPPTIASTLLNCYVTFHRSEALMSLQALCISPFNNVYSGP